MIPTKFDYRLLDYNFHTYPADFLCSQFPAQAVFETEHTLANVPAGTPNFYNISAYYQIFYLRQGSVDVWINGKKEEIPCPGLVFVPPCSRYYIVTTKPKTELSFLVVSLKTLQTLDQTLGLHFYDKFLLLSARKNFVFSLQEKQKEILNQHIAQWPPLLQYGCSMLRFALLIKIFSLICNVAGISETPANTEKSIPIQITELTFASMQQNFTLQEFSGKLYLSSDHIQRKFKQETGMTVMNYVICLKLGHAIQKMVHLPPKDAAKSAGFTDFSYFCKVFQKSFGETASHFHKRQLDFRKDRKFY